MKRDREVNILKFALGERPINNIACAYLFLLITATIIRAQIGDMRGNNTKSETRFAYARDVKKKNIIRRLISACLR